MKKHYEGGNVVPITTGNVRSSWVSTPNEQRERELSLRPILRVGAMNMQSYAAWEYQDKKERAAKVFGSLAAQLRAKRDGV